MKKRQQLPSNLLPFIWHFLRDYKIVVTVFVLIGIMAGFWGPFNSLIVKHIINLLPEAGDGNISILFWPAALIVINFIVFDNFTWRGYGYIHYKFVPMITNNMISTMLEHCLHKSHRFFQDNFSGSISKQITDLANNIEKIISIIMINFLRGASLLIMSFIASYFANPVFCQILMCWFTLFVVFSILMSRKLVILSDKQAETESVIVGALVDSLSNSNSIRIFSRIRHEISRMQPFFMAQQNAYRAKDLHALIMYAIQGGSIAVMMAFSVYFLVHLYGQNLITIGDFALILGLSMETGHMMWYTMSQIDDFNRAAGRCKQALTSLMQPLEVKDIEDAKVLDCKKAEITFQNVKFHYKGAEPLFENKSVTIQAGQKVGLVGYSGGGKTTFVNLILRLYDITDGRILIDGQDISEVTQDSLREQIGMIPQDPSLFHRSLIENIRYGRVDATDDEVIEAAKKAHAHEFISVLPQGYDSLVGERGIKLSGGQRQRIAIARAILKNAPILILDEATSQLDSVTESLIQESLWELMNTPIANHEAVLRDVGGGVTQRLHGAAKSGSSKTVLVIAHRLSTLLHMDRILVFDKGKIIEDGTHKELLKKDGMYRTLWDAQVGGFLGDDQKEC